jgi:outer membrane protein assembly factor BamA
VTLGFPFGAVRFPQVQGAVFGDVAQAWNKDFYDKRILGSYGLGFRMGLIPGLVLRLDLAQRFSFENNSPYQNPFGERRYVDFYFGYNY